MRPLFRSSPPEATPSSEEHPNNELVKWTQMACFLAKNGHVPQAYSYVQKAAALTQNSLEQGRKFVLNYSLATVGFLCVFAEGHGQAT